MESHCILFVNEKKILQTWMFTEINILINISLQGTQTELEAAKTADPEAINAAIVTFKTIRDARIASQCLWQAKPYNTFTIPAPQPKEIIWANLPYSILNQYVDFLFIVSDDITFIFALITKYCSQRRAGKRVWVLEAQHIALSRAFS